MRKKQQKNNPQKKQANQNDCKELTKFEEELLEKKLDEHIDEAFKKQLEVTIQIVREEMRTSIFQGPIPPPDFLEQYDKIVPGSADRLIKMAEKQSEHRQEIEKIAIKSDAKNSSRGTIFGFILGFTGIVGGVILTAMGANIAGMTAFLSSLGALTGVFLVGTGQRKKERIQKNQDMRKLK